MMRAIGSRRKPCCLGWHANERRSTPRRGAGCSWRCARRRTFTNLLVLCSVHHRAVHRGELLIDLERDGSLRFRHADGAAYGHPLIPQRIDAYAKVFSALRHLGFRESEVKTVLSELRADAELGDASVEYLLHEALCRIRPTAR
jgi:hypothetical protein